MWPERHRRCRGVGPSREPFARLRVRAGGRPSHRDLGFHSVVLPKVGNLGLFSDVPAAQELLAGLACAGVEAAQGVDVDQQSRIVDESKGKAASSRSTSTGASWSAVALYRFVALPT